MSETPAEEGDEQLMLLIDPGWSATPEEPEPPFERIVGGWRLHPDGSTGRFQANPGYQPTTPDSPTDPVDAVVHLVLDGESDGNDLLTVLPDAELGVALDEDGVAIVTESPDGVPSVLVTTAAAHRERIEAPGWMIVDVTQLAEALPPEGVDVLLNPGAPASMRVLASAVREAAAATGAP